MHLSTNRSLLRVLAVLAVFALVAAACGSGGDESGEDLQRSEDLELAEDVPRGGTLRIAGTSDADYMDPAAMYYTLTFFLSRGVHRTLTTYPKNVTDLAAQNELVGDLATDAGTPNDDFTQWTYTLKDEIRFGPKIGGDEVEGVTGEEIVCEDVKFGIERIFVQSVGGGYPFFYDIIEGVPDDYPVKNHPDISGIECQDEKTIVFNLSEPAGDWPFRMAMPATTPVAEEAAAQYDSKDDSNYDRHAVATGPYYISEWTPGEQISMERNEHWDPETDEAREAFVDSVDWKLGFENDVGVTKILDGEYHLGLDIEPKGAQLEDIVNDPEQSELLLTETSGCTRYVFLNTRIEPFDNQQVREALNWGIDRANIKRLFGGPVTGPIATSIVAPGIDGHLTAEEYNPFETPDMSGDKEKARELLAEAGYPDGYDGKIRVVGASDTPHDKIFQSVLQDLEELGFSNIQKKTPAFPNQYTQFYSVPDSDTAIGTAAGWCKDYQSAFTFLDPLFHGDNIAESGNNNYSELDDPEMNRLIDEAAATPPGPEQTAAWEEANRYATETAVWIPWSWDEEVLLESGDLVNAYYLGFHSHVDWVNLGVEEGS